VYSEKSLRIETFTLASSLSHFSSAFLSVFWKKLGELEIDDFLHVFGILSFSTFKYENFHVLVFFFFSSVLVIF
jgi:hypothetical protein